MNETAPVEQCHCYALRRASRHVSQLYDHYLAPFGLTVSQYALIARLSRCGPRSIQDLAEELVMDRTTLGRNLKPLERDGLITLEVNPEDRRSRSIVVTEHGRSLVAAAKPAWEAAQNRFEEVLGAAQAAALQASLQAVAEAEL